MSFDAHPQTCGFHRDANKSLGLRTKTRRFSSCDGACFVENAGGKRRTAVL
jgi:hypothetical protein